MSDGTFGAKNIGLSLSGGAFGAKNIGLTLFDGTFWAKNIGLTCSRALLELYRLYLSEGTFGARGLEEFFEGF